MHLQILTQAAFLYNISVIWHPCCHGPRVHFENGFCLYFMRVCVDDFMSPTLYVIAGNVVSSG